MINWETIKSLYNDKPTLLQWLKKVEAALAASVLQVVDVEKVSVSEIKLNFVFEDGTNIETPTIALPYEIQNVAIVNGHLILTLESGETLDAGNLGAVSGFSIDAAQHLIVTYQDGTSQDLGAIFQGNVNINGNLTTTGYIKPSAFELDYDITLSNVAQGLTAYYAHTRISNGKLSIVVGLYNVSSTPIDAETYQQVGTIPLSADVLNRLTPFISDVLAADNKYLTSVTGDLSDKPITMTISKAASGLRLHLNNLQISAYAGGSRSVRFEFNFML